MTDEKKISELEEAHYSANRELRKSVIEYITDYLNTLPDKSLVFEEVDPDISELMGITVIYDGGNHPEYYCNLFSKVSRVYLEDGEIYLDIEEETGYFVDRLWYIDDLLVIADAVRHCKNFKEEE